MQGNKLKIGDEVVFAYNGDLVKGIIDNFTNSYISVKAANKYNNVCFYNKMPHKVYKIISVEDFSYNIKQKEIF